MKKIIFLVVLFESIFCFSQDERRVERKNTISVEALGNGVILSLNYDRIILQNDFIRWFGRIGGSEYHGGGNELNFFAIYETGALFFGPKHHLDFGFGLTDGLNSKGIFIAPRLGYRFIGSQGFHARISPLMYTIGSSDEGFGKGDGFTGWWGALALGYSF